MLKRRHDLPQHSTPMRLAVFASGGGSNFEAICCAVDAGRLDAEVVLCLADRLNAGVLERATARGIPTIVLRRKDFPDDASFASRMERALDAADANFVALAGYLKRVPAAVVASFAGRMTNIHPALLPDFGGPGMYGEHVHRAVLESGARESGATVHLVDNDYDSGSIIAQRRVAVHTDDTPETLARRVLAIEHDLYPEVLQQFAREMDMQKENHER